VLGLEPLELLEPESEELFEPESEELFELDELLSVLDELDSDGFESPVRFDDPRLSFL
jgi:hypothetical protein